MMMESNNRSDRGETREMEGAYKEEKTRKVRLTHHFVFVLVPPGRMRGSNNVCVCVWRQER